MRGEHRAGGGHERVAATRHRRGARRGRRRRAPCSASARAPPATSRRRARAGTSTSAPALLDVHLDPGGHARAGTPARRACVSARHAAQRGEVAQHVALGIGAREHLVDVELAAQRARAEDRRAEARALLVDHRADRERPPRAAGAARGLDRDQPGHDAERAVERAAVGDRVDVRSDRVERALLPARLDRPEVAGRVLRDLQSECRRRSCGTSRARRPRPAPRPCGSSRRARARWPPARRRGAGRGRRRSRDRPAPRSRPSAAPGRPAPIR